MYEHIGGKAYVRTAVYANRHYVAAGYGCEKLSDALSQHVVSVGSGYAEAQHQRQTFACLAHCSACRLDGRLRVLCVEYRLYQQGVDAAFNQRLGLFCVGIAQSVVAEGMPARLCGV